MVAALLDYDAVAANPTILTGMSDLSILLNAIHARHPLGIWPDQAREAP
ncbi:LD-carboxypeptidase [Micromonospora sp. NBC_01412]